MTSRAELTVQELEAQVVDPLPTRAALASLLGGSLFDAGNVASLIGSVGAAGGNADQTAPIVQGLSTSPAAPGVGGASPPILPAF